MICLSWPGDSGYKKKCISEQNQSIKKNISGKALKKKKGSGIVVVRINWSGYPGYIKKIDMGINRGVLKLAQTPRLKKRKIYKWKKGKNIKRIRGKKKNLGKKI